MIKRIQLEEIPTYNCHWKSLLKSSISSCLKHGYEKWEKAEELTKLCKIAFLKKDWKSVREFLYKNF